MAGVESKHFTLSFFMPGQFKTQRRGGEHPQIGPREGTLLYYTHRMPEEKEKEEKEGGLNCSRRENGRKKTLIAPSSSSSPLANLLSIFRPSSSCVCVDILLLFCRE